MGGVLHELPLALLGLVERAEHRVEGGGERADLVARVDLDPLAEVARRPDALGRLAQVAQRAQRRPRDEEARDAGEADADHRDEEEPEPDPRELVVDAGELSDDLDRDRRRDAVECTV